ncbi:MAG: 4a-hydroxytetrahydrobiopterin dehydratase [Gammaproteobacteria bacterium HGW-Gammaproteobacteria-14]|nr:MAG: 4a-hydroxytetrahydrobiopterin dehydratase [Gammaproteobacteria bacterium HGW-Gammaproteobacteria-14]
MSLAEQACEACRADAPRATDEQVAQWRNEIPAWKLVEEDGVVKLQRQFSFADFSAAMAFSQQVAVLADSVGHHPSLLTEWGKVTVTWWTHKITGLHRNDFICAARTDQLLTNS